jgi:hypothetical protein
VVGVDREAGVVLGQPALVAPVVVPLAAVVLVAVEDADAPVDLDRLQVVVHQVVTPAVELERGGGRAVVEVEERVVERVVVADLAQRGGAEDGGHLRLEGLGEEAVDVVVAVVDEEESAVEHVALEMLALLAVELDQAVAGEVEEGGVQHRWVTQREHLLLGLDGERRVLHQRVEDVGRHPLVHPPVPRFVARANEGEVLHGIRTPLSPSGGERGNGLKRRRTSS